MDWSQKIKKILEVTGLRKIELSERCGIAPSSISTLLNGASNNPTANLIKSLSTLGISLEWMINDRGSIFLSDTAYGLIPIFYTDTNGDKPKPYLDLYAETAAEYPNHSILAVQISDECMSPTFHRGDFAIFAENLINGDGIYVIVENNQEFVRRLQFMPEKNTLLILSDNQLFQPRQLPLAEYQKTVRIVGRVVFRFCQM